MAGGVLVFLCATGIFLAYLAHHFEPYLRAKIVSGLADRFHTRVDLNYFHIAVHHGQAAEWGLWATGRGLRIWPPHREGGDHPLETAVQSKPLVDLGEFSFHVPIRWEMAKHLHIAQIRLKNLAIDVPPRSERDKQTGLQSAAAPEGNQPGSLANVTIDRIVCEGADLTLETDKPDRVALEFQIAHLNLTHLFPGQPMRFEAELTNPRPTGVIHSSGSFGPLDTADPGASPVSGQYQFDHADLSTFNGLAGFLNSTGNYHGSLRAITVDGVADVPDFRLTHFGNAVPLETRFHARVDGTDGDTWLDPVEASLGHSHFVTSGKVVRVGPAATADRRRNAAEHKPVAGKVSTDMPPPPELGPVQQGHVLDLKVRIDHGEMDDFLRLVSKSPTPLLTGEVTADANLHIAPGTEPVHLRVQLDGRFDLEDARFTSPKVQDKILELSLRGQGHPGAVRTADADKVRSQMQGEFHLSHGVITLPDLDYSVPGAEIRLKGAYSLDGPMHFDGTARMQATLSQMVGGWKGFMLKPVDRFFKKDGAGTLVPIKVRGSREDPEFGVDFGRIRHTTPQRPDQPQQSTSPERPGQNPPQP